MSTSKFSDPFMMKDPLSPLQGNAFIKAKIDAENAGKTSFSFNGRNYPLKMEAKQSPLGNHVFGHEESIVEKHIRPEKDPYMRARKRKEDSIFKDIGGRKGMKEMQMKMEKGIATKEEIAAWEKIIQDKKNKKKKK